jgi:hypothetical protein
MDAPDEIPYINASTFQKPLKQLAETLAQKVKREAPKLMSPAFVCIDLYMMMRQAMYTYDLLFYLNADERRDNDPYWKNVYTIVALPLVRNMIDCLYNVTAILQDPVGKGSLWRQSGYRKMLVNLDRKEQIYGGQPGWDESIRINREKIDLAIRSIGWTVAEVRAEKKQWPTLGAYIRNDNQPLTPHQEFLKKFLYGDWSKYSAMAHGAFEGLLEVGLYYTEDSLEHEERERLDREHPDFMSMCLSQAAAVLLCMATELQLYFHFDDGGAQIDERIHKMWNVLMPDLDVQDLYKGRYEVLMKQRGICP